MRKLPKLKLFVALFLTVALLLSALPVMAAAPQQVYPCFFTGSVAVDAGAVPAGTEVAAWVGGAEVATTTTGIAPLAANVYGLVVNLPAPAEVSFKVKRAVDADWLGASVNGVATITWAQYGRLTANLTAISGPPPARYFLTVVANPPGGGTVTVNPAQPVDGYVNGTVVNLTAIPAGDYTWTGWSGTNNNAINPTTVTMTSTKTVTAFFQPPLPPGEFEEWLGAGWSLMSTPMTLESDGDLNTFGEIVPPADVEAAYRFYRKRWYSVSSSYVLKPLEGIYVKVEEGGTTATFIADDNITAPPTRSLVAGWSIIGPAPPYDFQAWPACGVLASLWIGCCEASFSNVVSPALNQPGWAWSAIMITEVPAPDMLPFKGYWVYLEKADVLVGYSTTPLSPSP